MFYVGYTIINIVKDTLDNGNVLCIVYSIEYVIRQAVHLILAII